MDKAQAMSNYLDDYEKLMKSWLYFNVVLERAGSSSLLTDSDHTVAEYIDGTKQKSYQFSVAMVEQYDDGTSSENMDAYKSAVKFIDWIEHNNNLHLFPDFGEKCMVEEIKVLDAVPQVNIDSTGRLARYLVRLQVDYAERRK